MVQLTSWIPITVSGLGLTHGTAAVLFSHFCGLDKAVVVDVFLVGSILTYLVPLRNVCNLTGAERVPTPLSTVSYRL